MQPRARPTRPRWSASHRSRPAQRPEGAPCHRAHRRAKATHRPRCFVLTRLLPSPGPRARSLLPSPLEAAEGTRMKLGPAYWQQAARSIQSAKAPRPTCSPARRPCHPFERGRCANRAPRSVDLAKGNRSPEAQIPDHRRSGSTAARESAGRAAARAPVACVHGSCVDPAADRTLRPAGMAPVSGQMAASAQRRSLWNSSVLRHRRRGTAVGAGKDAPRPCACGPDRAIGHRLVKALRRRL